MKENRYPPGYVPLTVHKLGNQSSNSKGRSDNDRSNRRSHSNKSRPRRRRPNFDDRQQDKKEE